MIPRKSIAFLISSNYQAILDKCPDFLDEFRILKPIFLSYGVNLIKADWCDSSIDWSLFDAIIPKGCWDYMLYPNEFEIFLKKILNLNIPIKNDTTIVLWNMRKTYLSDLKKLNLPVAEFILIPQNSKVRYLDIIDKLNDANFDTSVIVAKPSIGGAAIDTVRFNIRDINLHEELFNKILLYADLILQPYFPEIATFGEYSYFFFANKFSHAVLKKPISGDYRAHKLFGAQNLAYQPSNKEIQQAFSFVAGLNSQCEYARVDVFKRNNKLLLIELELIEPYLYFELAPQSALHEFSQAIIGSIIKIPTQI